MLTTVNKKIACAPLTKTEIRSKVSHGIALMEHTTTLEKTKTVFPATSGLPVGSTVYLSGEAVKQDYAAKIYEENGVRFILVPEDQVIAIAPPEPASAPGILDQP